jgi:hypothetical protein
VAAGAEADAAAGDASPSQLPGYSVGRVVGEGGFCQVRLGVHHLSRRKVAVKVIDKARLGDANEARRVAREVRVLRRLRGHPCVIRLFEVVDAGPRLHLVMEYAPGGSLLDHVRAKKRLGEAEAAQFLVQIVSALAYCHDSEVRAGRPSGHLLTHLPVRARQQGSNPDWCDRRPQTRPELSRCGRRRGVPPPRAHPSPPLPRPRLSTGT